MAASKHFWNSEKIDQFIELWETKPCLYDTTREDYHDRNIKKKAREEIATALGISCEPVLNILDVKTTSLPVHTDRIIMFHNKST